MIVIEFRKEVHEENMELLKRVKKDICTLFERLEGGAHGERHYEIDSYDNRQSGSMNNRYEMDERRDSRGRYSRRDDRMEDRRYPEYPMYDERGGGRYNY